MSTEEQTDPTTDFRDENLYENLKKYFQSSMAIFGSLADMMQGEPFGREVVRTIDGEKVVKKNTKVDSSVFHRLTDSMESRWTELPHYTDCAGAFASSDLYKKELGLAKRHDVIEDVNEPEEHIRNDSLPKVFTRYLEKQGDLTFEEETFKQVYREFEDYLDSEEIVYRSFAILTGFQMEDEELKLESDLKLKMLNEDKVRDLTPHARRRLTHGDNGSPVIEKTFQRPKFADLDLSDTLDAVDDVITSLRLFEKNGDVRYRHVITTPLSPFHKDEDIRGGEPGMTFFDSPYRLESDSCEEFKSFWDVISNQIDDPPETYRIALDKFSNSFHRQNENDRLLDSVITLEALYLREGEQQEMSYRLSQRGALFLADSVDDAKEIKQNLKKAYSTRSTLVHGGTANVDHEFISDLHNITRRTLSKFLKLNDDGKNHEDIIESLDEDAIKPVNN